MNWLLSTLIGVLLASTSLTLVTLALAVYRMSKYDDMPEREPHKKRSPVTTTIGVTAEPTAKKRGITMIDGDDPVLQVKYDTAEDFKANNTQAYGTPDAPKKRK